MRGINIPYGTIIGGGFGFLLGGPIGGLVGLAFGYSFDKGLNRPEKDRDSLKEDNFNEHKKAGDYGESLFRNELRRLKGTVINGYISTGNMIFNKQNFEIDFLIMVPSVGFILAEIKYYGGTINCSSQNYWEQFANNGEIKKPKNASKQVLRTDRLLNQLLVKHGLSKWNIIPVVIFTHANATITKTINDLPQTDIITLPMFEKWINDLDNSKKINFKTEDFKQVYSVIRSYEKEFSHNK